MHHFCIKKEQLIYIGPFYLINVMTTEPIVLNQTRFQGRFMDAQNY